MRILGSNGENASRAPSILANMLKKARDDYGMVGGGEERATTSYDARREGERNSEAFIREAGENPENLFTWGLPSADQQEERQIPPAFDAGAAVRKLSQTKEYFAELCRNYLAHYKTQGADVRFVLPPSTTDSRYKPPAQEAFEVGRNVAREGPTASCSATARPSSIHHQPPAECRRMPSDFEYFLTRDILQLEFDPSNASYREELLALESRVLQMLDSLHHRDEQLVEIDPRSHECGQTVLCKARENKTGASELSQFRSYQFAFKAAAVAEIVRLKSDLSKSKSKVVELLCNKTVGKGVSGVRTQSELVKRLKSENEAVAVEIAQLRAERIASDEWIAEFAYLRGQVASCTCKHVGKRIPESTEGSLERKGSPSDRGQGVRAGRKSAGQGEKADSQTVVVAPSQTRGSLSPGVAGNNVGVNTTNAAAAGYVLKRPALDVTEQGHHDGQEIVSPLRAKVMRGCISSEDEVLLEGICGASVEKEVFTVIVEKLDAVKADMAIFVKTLQSRVASVAGKISRTESRVRPVKVGLFCLKLLMDKLQAKKVEIEASLVENSSDNAPSMPDTQLGLKLLFRS